MNGSFVYLFSITMRTVTAIRIVIMIHFIMTINERRLERFLSCQAEILDTFWVGEVDAAKLPVPGTSTDLQLQKMSFALWFLTLKDNSPLMTAYNVPILYRLNSNAKGIYLNRAGIIPRIEKQPWKKSHPGSWHVADDG